MNQHAVGRGIINLLKQECIRLVIKMHTIRLVQLSLNHLQVFIQCRLLAIISVKKKNEGRHFQLSKFFSL